MSRRLFDTRDGFKLILPQQEKDDKFGILQGKGYEIVQNMNFSHSRIKHG